MQGIAGAKKGHKEARERQISRDQCLCESVQKPVERGLAAPDSECKRLEQEIPPTENTANLSLFEKTA